MRKCTLQVGESSRKIKMGNQQNLITSDVKSREKITNMSPLHRIFAMGSEPDQI
jgi:hypothetical protein